MGQKWLMKSEPNTWSIDQQKKAGIKGATWDGVRNYQAANNLKKMKKGDLCFFYHSRIGKEVAGIVEVIKTAFLDPTDKKKRFVAVQVKFKKKLKKTVSLENIKKDKYNLAASFQNTIEIILYEKSKIAMSMFKENNKKVNSAFVIAGGVASNKKIRNTLKNLSIKKGFKPIFPPINLCSDNAAMIAWAGIEKFKLNLTDKLNFPARARWPLDENAPFMKGAGVKL